MDRILAAIPWPIWAFAMLAVAALIFARNTYKLRKQFGKATTVEEIRKAYPRAWINSLRLTHWHQEIPKMALAISNSIP
jgi:hypothetical protein